MGLEICPAFNHCPAFRTEHSGQSQVCGATLSGLSVVFGSWP
jgi:hypothetical protein